MRLLVPRLAVTDGRFSPDSEAPAVGQGVR
jgi:hypothetical protein